MRKRAGTPIMLLLALLVGCGTEDPEEMAGTPRAVETPQTREAVVRVEGMPDTLVLERYDAPEDFPLSFTTWMPEDMRVDPEMDGGEAIRFVADFGTPASRDAYLNVFVFEPGTTPADARGMARAIKTSRGVPVSQGLEPVAADGPDIFPWAVHEEPYVYQDNARWFVGRLAIGEHRDRYFLVVTHYPQEMAEGFEPRIRQVLEEWRWADGSPLSGAPGGD